MGTDTSPALVAWMVLLSGTFALVTYTLMWAATSVRPVRRRSQMTGRAAAPYWYSPTGHQDERGIIAVPLARI